MTNSECINDALGQRGSTEECPLEEAGLNSKGQSMGHAAKENGCGFSEKRLRGVDKSVLKPCEGNVALKRSLQDHPEAPLRKRIHVCGSNFGAADQRKSEEAAGSMKSPFGERGGTFVAGSEPDTTMNGVDNEAGDEDDGAEAAENTFIQIQLKRAVEGENSVVDGDVEMTENVERPDHEEVDTLVPLVEEASVVETDEIEEDEDPRLTGKGDEGLLRLAKQAEMMFPVTRESDRVQESANREVSSQHWWEGLDTTQMARTEKDIGEHSARVPNKPDESEEFLKRTETVQQICELLHATRELGNEVNFNCAESPTRAMKDIGEGSARGTDDKAEGSARGRDDTVKYEWNDSKHVDLSSEEDEPRSRNGYVHENVVEVIEVDDSDDEPVEMNDYESDGSSTKGKKPEKIGATLRRNVFKQPTSQSTSASYSPEEESDSDDDCQVVGAWNPNEKAQILQGNKADSEIEDDDSDSEDNRSEDSDSSDVIVAGPHSPHSEIQREWELAAMRRRMGRAMRSAGSKANGEHEGTAELDHAEGTRSEGLAESVATSTYRDSPDSTAESSEARGGVGVVNPSDVHIGARVAANSDGKLNMKYGEIIPPSTEAQEAGDYSFNPVTADANQLESPSLAPNGHVNSIEEGLNGVDHGTSPVSEARENDGAAENSDRGYLIALKENLKQTPEFMQADEEEWASRQQELQRQQLEAQKMRQRKRLEADRKQEMERKQKQRVQELRQNQMKAEKDMDVREQLRGQVREKLEYLASKCSDFAGLLRRLGVTVDGGTHPSEQQVNAAFKRALVKFHPDRVQADDPRRVVEAEETFKLINRTKKTLDGFDPFR